MYTLTYTDLYLVLTALVGFTAMLTMSLAIVTYMSGYAMRIDSLRRQGDANITAELESVKEKLARLQVARYIEKVRDITSPNIHMDAVTKRE
jgi:hypothetical protein